jgi:hypothetical protein
LIVSLGIILYIFIIFVSIFIVARELQIRLFSSPTLPIESTVPQLDRRRATTKERVGKRFEGVVEEWERGKEE